MSFQFSDAWILQAIFNSEKNSSGAILRDIIAFADYSNHSILTHSEFNLGISKLLNSKIIEMHQHKFFCKQNFKDWHTEKFKGKKRIDINKELVEMEKYLNTITDDFDSNHEQIKFIISEEAFKVAVNEYLSRCDR